MTQRDSQPPSSSTLCAAFGHHRTDTEGLYQASPPPAALSTTTARDPNSAVARPVSSSLAVQGQMSPPASSPAASRDSPAGNLSNCLPDNDLKGLVSRTLQKISHNLKAARSTLFDVKIIAEQIQHAKKDVLAEMNNFWSGVRDEFGEIIVRDNGISRYTGPLPG